MGRRLAHVVVGALVVAGGLVVVVPPAGACQCIPPVAGMTMPADATFDGTVVSSPDGSAAPRPLLVRYRIAIDRVVAGSIGEVGEVIDIDTPGTGCGFGPFDEGATFAAAVIRTKDGWWADLCSNGPPGSLDGVQLVEADARRRQLDAALEGFRATPTVVRDHSPAPRVDASSVLARAVVGGVAGLAVAAVAMFVVRRGRART